MPDNENILSLNIDLEPGSYRSGLKKDTDQLREEIKKLKIRKIDVIKEKELDPDNKAIETIILGSLVVKLAPAVLPSLIGVLSLWLSRHKERKLKMTIGSDSIELQGRSSEEEKEYLDDFIKRYQARS